MPSQKTYQKFGSSERRKDVPSTQENQLPGLSSSGLPSASLGAIPSISLPKGGGSISSMGEKFDVNAADGTGSVTIPISLSPGRGGFGPSISLCYNSGNGNGPFGMGWNLSVPNITRKTALGLPQYHDQDDSDVFMISGAEDLVPLYTRNAQDQIVVDEETGMPIIHETMRDDYLVRRYVPRVEGSFLRIERWSKISWPGHIHWRVTTPENITSIYGRDENSQIYDPLYPSEKRRIFSWLLAEQHDPLGNAVIYLYKAEDSTGVCVNQPNERNRSDESRGSNRYMRCIKYGNKSPNRNLESWDYFSAFDLPFSNWMFSVVFDYGEYDQSSPNLNPTGQWSCRKDPFSSYRSGFEIRTYRLCQRILMFHHFEELSVDDYLVSATKLVYYQQPSFSYMRSISHIGYLDNCAKSLPPVDFSYSCFPTDSELSCISAQEVDSTYLENVPSGVDGNKYQWVDLDGEGLSGILVEDSDGWFYKRNLSANNQDTLDSGSHTTPKFGPLTEISPKPPLSKFKGQCHFADVKGDGLLDVMWMGNQTWGYSGRHFDPDLGWAPFREFKSIPNIQMDENARFFDITGDGLADIVVTEERAFVCYRSLGENGYAPALRAIKSLNEEQGPSLLFGDLEQTIYLADMSGDGLTDLVRIRNGEVCYWPNTGYGNFAPKITMSNSPWFNESDEFNQRYIHLADVDGSGTTDILYVSSHGVDIYLNQAGNSFSKWKRLPNFPPIDSVSSVTTVDLLGNGTTCLVWSSKLPGNTKTSLRYLDLNPTGIKPHLLIGITNNQGVETHIHYAPSTKFYLEDKLVGRPWITRLPFPVHCVEKIEMFDLISHNRFATRYAYHHGYFDGYEREFRGFAMTEKWDTEEFGVIAKYGGENINPVWHVPPVHTKFWHHLGSFLNESMTQLATEYFEVPQHLEVGLTTLLEDSLVPKGLNYSAARESYRALKGHLLREEIYADDKSPKANIPYTITESNYEVRMLQPEDTHHHSVFMVIPRESVSFNFERNPTDPRVQHNLTLEVDRYGNIQKGLTVAYGRLKRTLRGEDSKIQEKLLMTYTENDYTNHIDTPRDYLLPHSFGSRTYQVYGFEQNESTRFTMAQFTSHHRPASLQEIPFEASPSGGKQRRLIQESRVLFRRNDLTGFLPKGSIESMAIVGQSYQLAFTPGLLNLFRQPLHNGSTKDLLPNTKEALEDFGRYVDLDENGHWWIPSSRAFFDLKATDSLMELSEAKRHFFSVRKHVDPFSNCTLVEFDKYDLLHVKTIDAIGNISLSRNDYRVLQPHLVIDPNGNRSVCAFDELGYVVAMAVMGKKDENVGDSLEGFHLTTQDEMELFFRDPTGPIAKVILGNATTCTIYETSRFWLEQDATKKRPNFQATIAREIHASDTISDDFKIQVSFMYIDGFGRTVQSKTQAEPQDGVSTWRTDGWIILNNKGNTVKKYEPFFDTRHDFVFNQKVGIGPTLVYDPLGRIVSLIYPNHSWTKFVFDNWQTKEYDTNDTVLMDPRSDPDIGPFVSLLLEEELYPTWFDTRISGQIGRAEQVAAEKASRHANTPTITNFDPLGRSFFSVADNGEFGQYETRVDLDIQGNLLHITDPKGRRVLDTSFNVIGQSIHTASPEFGERWVFCDTTGAQIYSWDSRMNRFRTEYDVLRRPISTILREGSAAEIMVDQIIYGESLEDPGLYNARGQISKICDQAGVINYVKYDFKGNLLCTERQLAKDYKNIVNWEQPVPLEDESFATQMSYDALNRTTQTTMPDKTTFRWQYNEASLLQSTIGNIRGADIPTSFIDNIKYNAKGQRLSIKYGNGVVTSYTHDALTTLLTHLTTRRNPRVFPNDFAKKHSASWPGSHIQNLYYTYDAIGNVTQIRDDSQQAIFFRNKRVNPNNEYTFDAIYRLIEATGREHLGLSKKPMKAIDFMSESADHPNDGKAMRTYTERFRYDEVGNFLSVKHHGNGGSDDGWTRNYFYEAASLLEPKRHSNRLSRTSIGSSTEHYAYEGPEGLCGNMTSIPSLSTMKWDFRNQLRATSRQIVNDGIPETTWYVYDSSGQRVRKITERQAAEGEEPVRLKERIYTGIEVYREYNSRGDIKLERETLHVMDEQTRIALIETRTQGSDRHVPEQLIRYQIGNHIGSVSLELSEDGSLISHEEYTPYGSISYQASRRELHSPQRYKYTSKERDEENGLDYYGSRYYCSDMGRWINCDPSGMEDGVNVYIYVHDNPVTWIDPDGRETYDDMKKRYWGYKTHDQRVNAFKADFAKYSKDEVYESEDNKTPSAEQAAAGAMTFAWSHRLPQIHQPIWEALGLEAYVRSADNGKWMPGMLHVALTSAGYDAMFAEKIGKVDFGAIMKEHGRDKGKKTAIELVFNIRDEVEKEFGLKESDWATERVYDKAKEGGRLQGYDTRSNDWYRRSQVQAAEINPGERLTAFFSRAPSPAVDAGAGVGAGGPPSGLFSHLPSPFLGAPAIALPYNPSTSSSSSSSSSSSVLPKKLTKAQQMAKDQATSHSINEFFK